MGDLISLLLLLALISAAGKLAEKIFLTKKRKQLERK
jgi:hypothetical protein